MGFQIKQVAFSLLVAVPVTGLLYFAALNPPTVMAVPSYARQTGLACSGCHYTPPELNPAGRKFKLTGYVDRGDDTKTVKADGGKKRAPLDLLASLPLSIMLETSFTSNSRLRSRKPRTATSSSLKISPCSFRAHGRASVGSFLQVTYDTQDDHFTSDNTDIRFADKTKIGRQGAGLRHRSQ